MLRYFYEKRMVMCRQTYCKLIIIVLLLAFTWGSKGSSLQDLWQKADEGLYVADFQSPQKSYGKDLCITIVRINPRYYSFKLLSAKELDLANMPVRNWCKKFGLIAGVNAGMYLTDYQTNVGYMKNFKHVNNPRINSKYKSVFAFNPINPAKPPARIYDIEEQNMNSLIENYNSVIQNLRLIKRPGRNMWSKQNQRWSEVALGEDKQGNILFIFCPSAYSMYELNHILLRLPIDLVCAQHLEGGVEASLYLSAGDIKIDKVGGFNEIAGNKVAWSTPNVLGIVRVKE
jgi:hypothetical protein